MQDKKEKPPRKNLLNFYELDISKLLPHYWNAETTYLPRSKIKEEKGRSNRETKLLEKESKTRMH